MRSNQLSYSPIRKLIIAVLSRTRKMENGELKNLLPLTAPHKSKTGADPGYGQQSAVLSFLDEPNHRVPSISRHSSCSVPWRLRHRSIGRAGQPGGCRPASWVDAARQHVAHSCCSRCHRDAHVTTNEDDEHCACSGAHLKPRASATPPSRSRTDSDRRRRPSSAPRRRLRPHPYPQHGEPIMHSNLCGLYATPPAIVQDHTFSVQ